MPLSILFWVIYLIAVLFGLWSTYEPGQPLWYRRAGSSLLVWILLGLLGWRVFGSMIHQ